ncbi:hypothetical protein DM75_4275 [Burkholderia mallei]|nr:hypothetical protein DM75_4275 [Burkholderia mallei]
MANKGAFTLGRKIAGRSPGNRRAIAGQSFGTAQLRHAAIQCDGRRRAWNGYCAAPSLAVSSRF